MDRCCQCNALVDTDDPDDCRYLPFGYRDERCVCDNCLPEMHLCQRCGFVCTPVEYDEVDDSEAWGAREVRRITYQLSDCCKETVEEVE